MPTTTASLANSAGWIDIPPRSIHEREPLIVEPMTSTSTSPTDRAEVDQRGQDPHPAVVGDEHRAGSARPIATLTSCGAGTPRDHRR